MGIRCFAPTVPSNINANSFCHSQKKIEEIELKKNEKFRST